MKNSFERYAFPLILTTAFLDILGLGILIPALPFLIEGYHMSPEWLGYVLSIYSLGMFFGWYVFGKMSDSYGRRKALLLTSFCNFVWYVFIIFAPTFFLFALGRFIAGLGGAGLGITQAYISDISEKEERTRRIGMIGAMFGLWFLVGPAIGGFLSTFGLHVVGYGWAAAVLTNLLLIFAFLPEPKKHVHAHMNEVPKSLHLNHPIVPLLVIAFFSTIAFSPIQGMSSQFYHDRFWFDTKGIAIVLTVVGLAAILYQGFLIKFVRAKFTDARMIFLGISILMISFVFQSINLDTNLLWAILPLFPLGMGSIQPSVSSLIAHESGSMAGRYLGLNTSVISLGNIIGPALAGWLYGFSITLPYWVAIGVYAMAIPFAFKSLRNEKLYVHGEGK